MGAAFFKLDEHRGGCCQLGRGIEGNSSNRAELGAVTELLHTVKGIFAEGVALKSGLEKAFHRLEMQHKDQSAFGVALHKIPDDLFNCPAIYGGHILTVRDANFLRAEFPYDVFISHTWDKDDAGRDNHLRAKQLNGSLQYLGFKTWFDNEQMHGDTHQRMAEGIERSLVILICVSRRYMEKVAQDEESNCKFEHNWAVRKRTTLNMLSVVMEESMQNTQEWVGSLGMILGVHLYHKLVSDVDAEFDDAVNGIAAAIRKKLELQTVLANEQQGVAGQISSRSPSPSPSDMSGKVTVPGSPWEEQDVFATHSPSRVSEVRDNMKEFMQDFLAKSSKQHRQWRLCELMLVGFVRNLVAPSFLASKVRGTCYKSIAGVSCDNAGCRSEASNLGRNHEHSQIQRRQQTDATLCRCYGWCSTLRGLLRGNRR